MITGRQMVGEYFYDKLGLRISDDFRGVCHLVPSITAGSVVRMEDVGVAIGYDSFIGRCCAMHVVIARPELFSRRILRGAFEFPFITCDCEVVLGLVDSVNEAAIEFNLRVGFTEACRIPNAGQEGDLVITRMLRGDCRWLRPH